MLWQPFATPSRLRQSLVLDGRRLIKQRNNQLTVGSHSRRDFWVGFVVGQHPIIWGDNWNNQNHNANFYTRRLKRLPIHYGAHNSQPKTGSSGGLGIREEVRLGGSAQRGCYSNVLAAIRCK